MQAFCFSLAELFEELYFGALKGDRSLIKALVNTSKTSTLNFNSWQKSYFARELFLRFNKIDSNKLKTNFNSEA